jgi:hypothetical protein
MFWRTITGWLRRLRPSTEPGLGDPEPLGAGLPVYWPPPPKLLDTTVRNCPLPFRVKCSLQWEGLQATDDPAVRHCEQCRRDVFFCRTDEETLAHARAGHCIAREEPGELALPRMVLGEPEEPIVVTAEQESAREWLARERGITDAIKNIDAIRNCPECGYPVPHWRTDCRVCGFAIGRVPGP